uniref:hypothetical protein n=1 Tax=Fulvivirga sp. TaxID=1931237 RepID=UPI004049C830
MAKINLFNSAEEFLQKKLLNDKNFSLGTLASLIVEWDIKQTDAKSLYHHMLKEGLRADNTFNLHNAPNVMVKYHSSTTQKRKSISKGFSM